MKHSEIIMQLNRIAAIYGYGGDAPKFADADWNAIIEAKRIINDYMRLTSKVQQLSRAVDKYKDKVEEEKTSVQLEHATMMEWFRFACNVNAENRRLTIENSELRDKLKNAGILSHAVGDRAIIKETGEIRKCGGIHIYISQTGIKSVRYHFENLEGYLKENDISWV